MKTKTEPKKGMILEFTRTILREDILAFAQLTGDLGEHHTRAERLMAHGLLVVSVVTKLGGDIDYVSRTMDMEFHNPLYEGEEVTGIIFLENVIETRQRFKVRMRCECK